MDDTLKRRVVAALQSALRDLDDASGGTEPSEDEEFAYAATLNELAAVLRELGEEPCIAGGPASPGGSGPPYDAATATGMYDYD